MSARARGSSSSIHTPSNLLGKSSPSLHISCGSAADAGSALRACSTGDRQTYCRVLAAVLAADRDRDRFVVVPADDDDDDGVVLVLGQDLPDLVHALYVVHASHHIHAYRTWVILATNAILQRR